MANSGDASGSSRGRTGMVIDAVSGVIIDAKGVVTPLPKAAAKELRKLEKRLAAARKTESKRLGASKPKRLGLRSPRWR